jgi:hypothetical protein
MLTYHAVVDQGGAVSTNSAGLVHDIATFPPGLYEIFETMSGIQRGFSRDP